MRRATRLSSSSLTAAAGLLLLMLALLTCWAAPARAAVTTSPRVWNPGFELPPTVPTMASDGWTIVSQAVAGNVVMRQMDGAPEYPVFAGLNGGTVVRPRTGVWMLRFGLPKGTDSHQAKGITKISQTFASVGTDIRLAFRVFTWEHNDSDTFVIDIKDGSGKSVGTLADKELLDIGATSVVTGTGALPYTLDLHVEPRQVKYKDTGWQDVRIVNLPGKVGAPQQLTVSLVLDTNTTAAHDSWVYVDSSDIIPPTTTAGGAPPANAAGWNNSDVAVTLAATDDIGDTGGSGVAKTYYRIGSGVGTLYDPDKKPVLTSTAPTLTYWSTDRAGNAETAKPFSAKIDKTAPTVTIISPADKSTLSDPSPALKYTAVDEAGGSGLALGSYLVSVDGTPLLLPAAILGPLSNGTHTLVVTALDVAGNKGAATSTFTVAVAPPISAEFTIAPGTRSGGDVLGVSEGDLVGLYADATGNSRGSQDGKTWDWTITASGPDTVNLDPVTFAGPVGFVVLDAKAAYRVQLKVTDTATGATRSTEQTIEALAEPPRVHALDIEAVQGQPATLVGRFLDPGFMQTHTATWTIDGIETTGTVSEDNLAAMDSGYVSGVAPGNLSVGEHPGSLIVTDSTGASATAGFTLTVREPRDAAVDKGGDGTFAQATQVEGGGAYVSRIASANGVDIFKVATPNGDPLPYGSEVLVTLRDLPADYDLAVIQDLGQGVDTSSQAAAFNGSSFASAGGVRHIPLQDVGGVRHIPYLDSGGVRHIPFEDAGGVRHIPFIDSAYLDAGGVRHIPYVDAGGVRHIEYVDVGGVRHIEYYVDAGGVRHIEYVDAGGVRHIDYVDSGGVRHIPFQRDPLDSMLFTHGPTPAGSLDGYSFADMSYTGLGNGGTSGSDISWEQLGFDNAAMAGKQVAGFSANSGTQAEVVLATTDFVGGDTYIAVRGANGASSEQPYTLQVETSVPQDTLASMNAGATPAAKVPNPTTTTPAVAVSNPSPEPKTLFVTAPERFDAIYRTAADPTPLETDLLGTPDSPKPLRAVCSNPLVQGEVLSIPASIYDAWDKAPWDTQKANAVTDKIRGYIDVYLNGHSSIQYVVMVGGDNVLPQRRVPDQTVLGNERTYAADSWLRADSPLYASMFDSMVLTDDYYVDAQPIAYNGRALYAPDRAVSRLVETPAEIAGAIQQFIDSNGTLAGGSAVVTGQDFMNDGAQRVQNILSAANMGPRLENLDTWQAGSVRQDLLSAPRDVGAINAHFLHYGGISAFGYNTPGSKLGVDGEFLSSTEIAGASGFTGKLVFTMGCHAGLSVPDDQVDPTLRSDPTGFVNPKLDIAQAVAQRKGVLVGSTGYGFGDTETIAGTEALIGSFADQATTADGATAAGRGQSIGLALAAAKRQYLGSLTAVTPYDEKSSIEFTMYGMPQYRLACKTHEADTGLQTAGVVGAKSAGLSPNAQTPARQYSGTSPTSFTLHVVDTDGTTDDYAATLQPSSEGTYFTANGDSQATASRPVQPRVVIDLGSGGANPVKGAVVTGGSHVDLTGFDPAISRWTNEWEANVAEFQVATDGWWPAGPVAVTTITGATQGQTEQRLVVLPGQFLATSVAGDPISGTERLWSDLTVKLVRGPVPTATTDNLAPVVNSVSLAKSGDTVTVKVDATDASEIARIDVTQVGTTPAQHSSLVTAAGQAGPYTVTLYLPGVPVADVAVTVDVVDRAGNVTTMNAKGALLTGPPTGTMTLNNSVPKTYSSLVPLASSVIGATQMRTSTDHTNWSSWRPYEASSIAALAGLPGAKTVYVQYRNADPNPLELSAPITRAALPMATGAASTLTRRSDGSLWGSGWNSSSQLGDGTTTDRDAPVPIGGDKDWTAIAVGAYHSLALKADGSLWAWGSNDLGRLGDGTTIDKSAPVRIGLDSDWTAVAAGQFHSLALKADGSLWAWGDNSVGELGDSTTAERDTPVRIGDDSNWTAVSACGSFSLALKADGSLWAWGYNADGEVGNGTTTYQLLEPTRIGTANDWTSIAAGGNHSLALKADGSLWAWGYNLQGQLGDGTTTDCHVPERIGTGNDWTSIAAGYVHSLAVKSDGSLWAWGYDGYGQLGDGSTGAGRSVPGQVGVANDWAAIAAGQYHSVAIRAGGNVWAWGGNMYGQLGDGTTANSLVPEQVFKLADTTTPPTGTMALNGGAAQTYASLVTLDSSGVRGADEMCTSVDGATWTAWRPYAASSVVALPGLPGAKTVHVRYRNADPTVLERTASVTLVATPIAAGAESSVALAADGSLWAWGWNRSGQLGDGTTTNQTSPEHVGGVGAWTAIAAGDEHTLALKADGSLWAWGDGSAGALGDGTVNSHLSPNQVGTDTHWAAIAAGRSHSLAIMSDGSLWGWGANGNGQLGDNLSNQHRSPVRNGIDSDWVAIAAGSFHTLALKANGTLWSCGYNSYGQLGDGSTNDSHALLQIGSDDNWAAIAAGESYNLAIKTDGTLWAWGHNDYGQMGDNSTSDSHVPVRIGTAHDWAAINATINNSLALKTDGTLWGWGANNFGLLGDGTYSAHHIPVQIGTETDWTAITSGFMHSMALKSDGTVWTTGYNSNGQLGDPGTTMTNVRISVFDRATSTP